MSLALNKMKCRKDLANSIRGWQKQRGQPPKTWGRSGYQDLYIFTKNIISIRIKEQMMKREIK